ncbi:MAG: hypothetical protein K6G51_05910 [Sphaerochaetaceae bacterium]|nr:hypothetical protein [Sphaerochaetaceae bacterium]
MVSLLPLQAKQNKSTLIYDSVHDKEKEFEINVDWSLDHLKKDPSVYNDELAKAAAILARSIYVSNERLESNLKILGYSKFEIHEENDKVSKPVCAFAHQGDNNANYFVIIVRGTKSYFDAATDVYAVSDSFSGASEYVFGEVENYIKTIEPGDSNNKKNVFFVTGHSLGGAVANALSLLLEKYTSEENIFTYTFEAPSLNVPVEKKGETRALNLINANDIIPTLPAPEGRYGSDVRYDPSFLDPTLYIQVSSRSLDDLYSTDMAATSYNHFMDQSMCYVLTRANETDI